MALGGGNGGGGAAGGGGACCSPSTRRGLKRQSAPSEYSPRELQEGSQLSGANSTCFVKDL